MSGPASRIAIIRALLKKEFIAYSRDTVYLALTLAVLVAVPFVFRALPDRVDESITLAISPPASVILSEGTEALRALGATEEQLAALRNVDLAEQQEGVTLVEFEDPKRMQDAVRGSLEVWRTSEGAIVLRDKKAGDKKPADAERLDVQVGIEFPPTFIADVATGAKGVTVTIYSDAGVPAEIRTATRSFVREAAYQLAGRELPVTLPAEQSIVLGEDRVGNQVTLQERMRPLLLFMVLLMETFSMASLVSTEVLQRTVTAVLVTPAKVADFLAAKSIFGTFMSLGQALVVLALIGGLTSTSWSLVLVALLAGAVMFTGVAMFVGAAGKDFMGQLFYAMLVTVPLLVPAVAVMFPGTAAVWVRAIPTYPIIDVLVRTTVYGEGWRELWPSFAYAAAWLAVIYTAGLVALKRKVESL
jgi:ABC-2 type transport system permease protein